MSKIQVRVDGDAKGGFIVEIHGGDQYRTYGPEAEHPMQAAQEAARAFVEEFPHHEDSEWLHPVDAKGEKLAHPADYMTADPKLADPNLQPNAAISEDSKAAGLLAAAGSADAGSGDVGDGAPEVSGKVPNGAQMAPNGPQPAPIEPTSDAAS